MLPSLLLAALLISAGRAHAATYEVTGVNDGAGSVDTGHAGDQGDPFLATTLRAAINAANSAAATIRCIKPLRGRHRP